MKISKQELIEMKACSDGLKRFMQQTNNTDEPVDVASLVNGKNTYSDLLWLAGEKLDKSRIVRFACDCALLNIELIKPYTDKYDLIVEFLKNPNAAITAYAADAAAANAAYAAYAAARAADVTYADAADARATAAAAVYAADAVRAASRAAYAAATAEATRAAARAATRAATRAAYAAAYAAEATRAAARAADVTYAYAAADACNSEKVTQLLIDMFNETE